MCKPKNLKLSKKKNLDLTMLKWAYFMDRPMLIVLSELNLDYYV